MGIKKLFTFLNNNKLYECYPYLNNIYDEYNLDKEMSLVGVDANLFCYKYMHSYDNMLIGFFNQILKFLSNKIIPLYIFDGGVLPEKEFSSGAEMFEAAKPIFETNAMDVKIGRAADAPRRRFINSMLVKEGIIVDISEKPTGGKRRKSSKKRSKKSSKKSSKKRSSKKSKNSKKRSTKK